MENVILVNEYDQELGVMEKMEAHRKGELHRAVSVFVFNSQGEMLLQQRSPDKYHSGGLWTNTCCSHPRPGETASAAAKRRLKEEMGIDLQPTFSHTFIYKISLDQNLVEHELDHVFTATYDGQPQINLEEVAAWKYVSLKELREDLLRHPEKYTYWFRVIMDDPNLKLKFSEQ